MLRRQCKMPNAECKGAAARCQAVARTNASSTSSTTVGECRCIDGTVRVAVVVLNDFPDFMRKPFTERFRAFRRPAVLHIEECRPEHVLHILRQTVQTLLAASHPLQRFQRRLRQPRHQHNVSSCAILDQGRYAGVWGQPQAGSVSSTSWPIQCEGPAREHAGAEPAEPDCGGVWNRLLPAALSDSCVSLPLLAVTRRTGRPSSSDHRWASRVRKRPERPRRARRATPAARGRDAP